MPVYHRLGEIPSKRHKVFRKPSGELYAEELMGNMGFVGPSSLLYHVERPTAVRAVHTVKEIHWNPAPCEPLRHRHFRTKQLTTPGDAILDRIPLLFNNDVSMSFVRPADEVSQFYRNAQGDEIVYVSGGRGRLESPFGSIEFSEGDYIVIPRGILHRYRFTSEERTLLIIESAGYVRPPKRYRNEYGQLIESSPYSERDMRCPENLETHDEKGEFRLIVKKANSLTEMMLAYHPFDVIGWDGYYYPWAMNIHNFEPRVGRFHLPPPTHQMFEGDGFVVCSFCPRPYDFDPEAVPAPYNHSNVMSDEVLYYANSEFMSRKGIEYGSITLHPDGLAHGPQPGRTEASIGQKETNELAVMMDTFRGLYVSQEACGVEDKNYYLSWLDT
ncbi:MAG: homogentisate 1,2-dioxygenase [Acidobacteriaceae bacterium]|nr:homogentisate 1,2-dioxygenase [Acidobacteriaceae bacterium]MBV9780631.1 homogentisate 1,2-dioxygenase [Acidobacteriaceae bacterium]